MVFSKSLHLYAQLLMYYPLQSTANLNVLSMQLKATAVSWGSGHHVGANGTTLPKAATKNNAINFIDTTAECYTAYKVSTAILQRQ